MKQKLMNKLFACLSYHLQSKEPVNASNQPKSNIRHLDGILISDEIGKELSCEITIVEEKGNVFLVNLSPNEIVSELSNKDKIDDILNSIINISDNTGDNGSKSVIHSSEFSKSGNRVICLPEKTIFEELHEKRSTDNCLKNKSFSLAIAMSVIGTLIIFVGILITLFTGKEIGWITTSSGAIIELVACVYFRFVKRTMKEVKDNSKHLEITENLLIAIELAEKINDTKTKDETYKDMIDKLLQKNDK